jgi:transcriptional regulator with XRE-family HTH domain
MIDAAPTIGQRLRALRNSLDMDQSSIAAMVGVTQAAWSQYERGRRQIDIEVAGNVATRFGVTLDWIYRGDPSGLPMRLATILTT